MRCCCYCCCCCAGTAHAHLPPRLSAALGAAAVIKVLWLKLGCSNAGCCAPRTCHLSTQPRARPEVLKHFAQLQTGHPHRVSWQGVVLLAVGNNKPHVL